MQHSILFTGHMIDAPDRENPRFPPEKEDAVREAIKMHLLREKAAGENFIGIAGGACGGDIIFHEQCSELGIPTEMYLALPVPDFIKESVSFAGADWVVRFEKLRSRIPVHILPEAEADGQDANVWERSNLWMLETGLKNRGEHMTLIALWDGKGGDGSGGTEHMVQVARGKGAKAEIIQINKL